MTDWEKAPMPYGDGTGPLSAFPSKLELNAAYGKRRPARRPRFAGRHGDRVKGSIRWDGGAYRVVYSYLLGYETTARVAEGFMNWSTAMSVYREHDRTVRERKKLEDFRAVRAVL